MSTATLEKQEQPVDREIQRQKIDEANRWIEQRGIPITICDGKGPRYKNWRDRRFTPEQVGVMLIATAKNVGVILGPDSGIIDIEYDSDQAKLDFARLFAGVAVPRTPTFQGRRSPHHLFRYPQRLKDSETAITHFGECEIRGTNTKSTQTVVPPSATNGFTRQWIVTPEECDFAELPDIVVQRILDEAAKDAKPEKQKPAKSTKQKPGRPKVAKSGTKNTGAIAGLLVEPYLAHYAVEIREQKTGPGDAETIYVVRCPWENEHSESDGYNTGTSFTVLQSGYVMFRCMHTHCANRTIHDALAAIGAPLPEHYDQDAIETDPAVMNYRTVTVDDEGGEVTKPLTFNQIVAKMHSVFGDWPARVSSHLFYDTGSGIDTLETPGKLFGWLRGEERIISWKGGCDMMGTSEFHAELSRTATRYLSVEDWPHEPEIPGHYYTKRDLPEPTGKAIEQLLDRFTPESPADRQLILAAAMTLLWGSADGSKPCFAITSEQGRGVGKTTLVNMLARLVGGVIDFSNKDTSEKIKERLLTPNECVKRVALIDNVKSLGLSWPELEALITSPTISGRQLYVGGASRPNTLTWFLTLNNAQLSRDMAQRSVIVNLATHKCSGTWETDLYEFIDKNHLAIIADLLARLRAPCPQLPRFTRWARWEAAVLARLDQPDMLQELIRIRQGETDTDNRAMELIEDGFRQRLIILEYDPETQRVHIPNELAAKWYREIENDKNITSKQCSSISQLVKENPKWRLKNNPSHKKGRGFVWEGEHAVDSVLYDIDEAIRIKNKTHWQV